MGIYRRSLIIKLIVTFLVLWVGTAKHIPVLLLREVIPQLSKARDSLQCAGCSLAIVDWKAWRPAAFQRTLQPFSPVSWSFQTRWSGDLQGVGLECLPHSSFSSSHSPPPLLLLPLFGSLRSPSTSSVSTPPFFSTISTPPPSCPSLSRLRGAAAGGGVSGWKQKLGGPGSESREPW